MGYKRYNCIHGLIIMTGYCLLAALLLTSGCKRNEGQRISLDGAAGFSKVYESGPVQVEQHIANTRIRVADNLHIQIKALAPENIAIEFPEPGDALEQWQVGDSYQELPRLGGDNVMVHVWNLVLLPPQAGEIAVPGLEISFHSRDNQDSVQKFKTEPVPVTVISLLDPNLQQQDIEDILAPVSIPSKRWLIIALVAIGLLILAGAGYWYWRTRKQAEAVVAALPPHVIALKALQELLDGRLVEAGRFKEFYFAVSAILRRYIEDRFELRAPESTTEEFLYDLGSTNALEQGHKQLLKQFLQHCDQVKFAKYQPSSAEIEQTATLCKQFIQETKAVESAGEATNAV